jgi:o-succinylbenzoate synthase
MKVERIEQFYVQMRLKQVFETSFGQEELVEKVVVCVHADGMAGYGESPVEKNPYYSAETADTCWMIQRDYLIPMLLGSTIKHASDIPAHLGRVRGHPMAKAGLEAAVWDLEAQMAGISVAKLLGSTRDTINSGVSIGIQSTVEALLGQIDSFCKEGYQRIKIKIKPGWDHKVVKEVRAHFPNIQLMVDANSAYSLDDSAMLKALDGYDLLMIEQPLAYDDILDHATLQQQLHTPICLDESIHTVGRAREALILKSCQIINIKPARVGGMTQARAIHDICQAQHIPVWCGGLLESGIGRAHNVAIASLPNFSLPGDTSASDRYWQEDIVDPPFVLNGDGTMDVPSGPGIGVRVLRDKLAQVSAQTADYSP